MAHELQSTEVSRLLSRRIRRGRTIFGVLFIVLTAFSGLAWVARREALAVSAFLAALLFGLAFDHVRKRRISVRNVSANPQQVYWAHPTVIPPQHRWLYRYTRLQFVTLHLRDGSRFEAGLTADEMQSFIDWLKHRNPSVRFGTYDAFDSTMSP